MNILINVIVIGMAIAFLWSTFDAMVEKHFSTRYLKLFLTLPLAVVFCSFLDMMTVFEIAVAAPAASFFALSAMLLIDRPVKVITRR